MKKSSPEDQIEDVRRMDNGEVRHRMKFPDGSAYIRTEAPTEYETSWQNAHFHMGMGEMYVVQKGWMALATIILYQNVVRVYREGEFVDIKKDQPHNVFLPRGGVIHTVQYGQPVGNPTRKGNDWWPASEDFDLWTKQLTLEDIARKAVVDICFLEATLE